MKRFLVILLALGLIAAFSTTVFAVDVKFSGEYYAAGMYLDKTTLHKGYYDTKTEKDVLEGPSTAFYYQRLRVRTDFAVTPGLTLITRFDAMERAWGASRSDSSDPKKGGARAVDSAGTVAENENFVFDWAYIEYKAPIGVFNVGYMNYGSTGTIFGNNSAPEARIKYSYTIGPITINPAISKIKEGDYSSLNNAGVTDADNDVYHLEGVYSWKGGRAGLNVNYYNYAGNRTHATQPYKREYFLFTPYVMAKIGPVALQAEFNYATGEDEYEHPATTKDADIESYSGWVDATADFGMFYAGGTIAYVSGDGDANDDKVEDVLNGGRDWSPCLIMWNYDRTNWAGALEGYNGTKQDTSMTNGWFFQVRGGLRPVDKLDIMASVAYARADKPRTILDREYGWEADLTATYKITNNLSYMLGMGYLFAGDYYKGTNGANDINNDFLVINKLTLTF
jgi:hypothetical protein